MTTALIVGAGAGLSAALARALALRGHDLLLAARDTSDLGALAAETGARLVDGDAATPEGMDRIMAAADAMAGPLAVAAYNPSARVRGPITDLDPGAVLDALRVTAFGAFLMAQAAARRMLPEAAAGRPAALLFTGASAGIKGYPRSAWAWEVEVRPWVETF